MEPQIQSDVEESDDEQSELELEDYKFKPEKIEEMDNKIEQEPQNIRHILEVKKQLLTYQNLTEKELEDTLHRLVFLVYTIEHLRITMIGNIVCSFQKHWSPKVNRQAKRVTDTFKKIIKHQLKDNFSLLAKAKDPEAPTELDENVLLVPPMDEGILISYFLPLEQYLRCLNLDDIDENGNSLEDNVGKGIEKIESSVKREMKHSESASSSVRAMEREKRRLINLLITGPNKDTPVFKSIEEEMKEDELKNQSKPFYLLVDDDDLRRSCKTKKAQKVTKKKTNLKFTIRRNFRPSDTQSSLLRFQMHKETIEMEKNSLKTTEERKEEKDESKDKKEQALKNVIVHPKSDVDPTPPKRSRESLWDVAKKEEDEKSPKKKRKHDEMVESSRRKLQEAHRAREKESKKSRKYKEEKHYKMSREREENSRKNREERNARDNARDRESKKSRKHKEEEEHYEMSNKGEENSRKNNSSHSTYREERSARERVIKRSRKYSEEHYEIPKNNHSSRTSRYTSNPSWRS